MNGLGEQSVALRPLYDSDMDALFRQMSDPASVRMAAFTPDDPDDRERFDAHMSRVMESPETTNRAITWNGDLVGSIASFVVDGQVEITYWVDRAVWGRGIASQALVLFLELDRTRPLYARAASDNLGSLRVLAKSRIPHHRHRGVLRTGTPREIEETILRLG